MKRPVFASTFVQRLLRGESTCVRFFTSPLRPLPLGPFFAIVLLYHRTNVATVQSTAAMHTARLFYPDAQSRPWSPCALRFLLFLQIKTHGVDAVSLPRFCRAVLKDVSKVRSAAGTRNFSLCHAHRVINMCFNGARKCLVE